MPLAASKISFASFWPCERRHDTHTLLHTHRETGYLDGRCLFFFFFRDFRSLCSFRLRQAGWLLEEEGSIAAAVLWLDGSAAKEGGRHPQATGRGWPCMHDPPPRSATLAVVSAALPGIGALFFLFCGQTDLAVAQSYIQCILSAGRALAKRDRHAQRHGLLEKDQEHGLLHGALHGVRNRARCTSDHTHARTVICPAALGAAGRCIGAAPGAD